ncbi:MAG: hypothetical protein R3E39_14855 [Anaerolineae bacterium]
MTFNPNDYLPKSNSWFSKKPRYKGLGRAEFLNPKGWVEGQVTVLYDESGHETITMQIDGFYHERWAEIGDFSHLYNLMWILNGIPPNTDGLGISYTPQTKNTCSNLIVKTANGDFKNYGRVLYGHNGAANGQIHFFVSEAMFTSKEITNAKYWVMPLTNFVSEDMRLITERIVGTPLYEHPLRRWKFPLISENLDVEERRQLIRQLDFWSSIVSFGYNGLWAFIEPVAEYEKYKTRLLKGSGDRLITALAVGEIGNQSIGSEAMENWIPLELLRLLSLSTGSIVGTPWIEFRDAKGHLIQRTHRSQNVTRFHKGHTAIDYTCAGGISQILSIAPLDLGSHLRVALELVVKGGQDVFDPADSLDFFFRAFDTLTKNFRHVKRNITIDTKRQSKITDILQNAQTEIVKIGDEAIREEKAAIKNIAYKVSTADQPTRNSEAEGLIELVNSLNLNDFKDVISDIDKWTQLYTKYRTQIIHESFFSRHTNTNNIDEIAYLYRYLHDLLIRIILKRLNYSGEYLSPIANEHKVSIDWVTPKTTPSELGIGRKLIL